MQRESRFFPQTKVDWIIRRAEYRRLLTNVPQEEKTICQTFSFLAPIKPIVSDIGPFEIPEKRMSNMRCRTDFVL